jgi:maltoporin
MRHTLASHALSRLTAAVALLAAAGAAQAVDFSGYFRGGPGLTSKNTSRACYHLNEGAGNGIAHGLNYRLGNECDLYGEFQGTQGFKADGLDYSATLMVTHYSNGTDIKNKELAIEQMYAEVKGFDVLPEGSFWIGKRRGRRGDVHIVDWFFTDMKGVGAGVGGISVGSGKLGFAWYKTDGDSTDTRPGNRLNLEVLDIASNPGGKTNLFFTYVNGDFTGGTNGLGFSVRHNQDLGGNFSNTLWAQVATGSASLESNFGDLTRKSGAKSYRLVDSINWQNGRFGGQALALIGNSEDNNGKKTTASTIGGRVSYGITKNFKMVSELGFSQYKTDGSDTAKQTKLTIAPTLSVNSDFWSRPELRLYVTTAKWNAAAGNVTGQAGFADKTKGTSGGAQVEWWF